MEKPQEHIEALGGFRASEIRATVKVLVREGKDTQEALKGLDKRSGYLNATGIGPKRKRIVEWLRGLSSETFEQVVHPQGNAGLQGQSDILPNGEFEV